MVGGTPGARTRLDACRLETRSRLGFWARRETRPLRTELRVYPNLHRERKNLAALFLGSVPPGGYAESEVALRKAIEFAPLVMRHQYELAILYIDWGREEEAVEVLRRAAQLPVQVASDVPRLKKIRSLLRDRESR